MADKTGSKISEDAPKAVSRRNFIKGVITSGVAVSSASYLFRASSLLQGQQLTAGVGERLITLNVNGQQRRVDVMKQETLASTLRYKLGLTCTKLGCDRAECGSCTVLIDDIPYYSCSVLTHTVRSRKVMTIEGLASAEGTLHHRGRLGTLQEHNSAANPRSGLAGVVVKGKQHEGEEVWGSSPNLGIVRDGSHAEYVVVPAEILALRPKSLSVAQAAAIGVPFITTWASVVSAAQIQPGETILIIGAAGAVGQAATQIANWKQARVIGADTTSDPIPGSELVVNTKTEDLRERVLELTAGRGVDAVFDTVGGPMFEPALQSLRFGGRQVAISSAGAPRVSFNLMDSYHNFSRLVGVDSYGLTSRQVGEIADKLRSGLETRVLKPPPIEVVPFEKAVEAYSRLAAGKAKAKQVLSFDWRDCISN